MPIQTASAHRRTVVGMAAAVAPAATLAVKEEQQGEALIQTRAVTVRWDKGALSLRVEVITALAAAVVVAMLVVAAVVLGVKTLLQT